LANGILNFVQCQFRPHAQIFRLTQNRNLAATCAAALILQILETLAMRNGGTPSTQRAKLITASRYPHALQDRALYKQKRVEQIESWAVG
jgi:hypothetical protein